MRFTVVSAGPTAWSWRNLDAAGRIVCDSGTHFAGEAYAWDGAEAFKKAAKADGIKLERPQ